MELRIFLIVAILGTLSSSMVFAQAITLDVDITQFEPGELVDLKGSVPSGLENKVVAVEIKDAGGNVILIRTVQADADGNFSIEFRIPSTAVAGEFDVVTNVDIEGQAFSETKTVDASEPAPEPELIAEPVSELQCGPGTHEENGQCVADARGGGCLIATATFGSELAPQVQQLREIRDNFLLQTESGSAFMESFNQFYYSFSPGIADLERENPVFKEAVKLTITPLLSSLSLLNYVDMNSEVEVLGYGISLILLNVGMYFVIPAIVIHRVRKYV